MLWKRQPDKQEIASVLQEFAAHHDNVFVPGDIVVQGSHVIASLEMRAPYGMEMEKLRELAEARLKALKHVKSVQLVLTAEKKPGEKIMTQKQVSAARDVAPEAGAIIAVASGKGGVGKSTVAVNLAMALQQQGLRVGILDADVYGPSVPMLLGVRDSKPENTDEYLLPVEKHGLKIMSMGFMVDEAAPMVWRGPMVQSALLQMLRDVKWGRLDVLLIDMPPGTGDTQLTIAQKVKLKGAVIVSTPQDIALLDTVKGVHMFEKMSVPILGIIENMSYFHCPNCSHDSHIFGAHGARNRAKELGVDFLGEIPLQAELREASDKGVPIVLQGETEAARIFSAIAGTIWGKLQSGETQKPAPKIIIEPAA